VKVHPTESAPTPRRLTLLFVPGVVVHLAVVLLVAVAIVTLRQAGVEHALERVKLVLLAVAAVSMAFALVALARMRRRVPLPMAVGLAALFGSYLCALLAALPPLARAAAALGVAQWAFTILGLPLLLLSAWRALRRGREDE
jgi:hypothetical protein